MRDPGRDRDRLEAQPGEQSVGLLEGGEQGGGVRAVEGESTARAPARGLGERRSTVRAVVRVGVRPHGSSLPLSGRRGRLVVAQIT